MTADTESGASQIREIALNHTNEEPIIVGYRKGESLPFNTCEDMAAYIAKVKCFVDASFMDVLGTVHHFTFSPNQCEVHDLKNGWAFDGSSIRLFKSIEESDMLLVPDCNTCWIDPFSRHLTLHVTCNVKQPDRKKEN